MQISGELTLYIRGKTKLLLAIPGIVEDWGNKTGTPVDLEFLQYEIFNYELLEDLDPEETVVLEGETDLDDEPMDWLEAVAARIPELEIALIAALDYSVCGSALFACCSPAGSKTLMPEDWEGEWFPAGKEIASWETSVEELDPLEIDLGFPADWDWVDFLSGWLDADEDEDEEEDEE